MQHVVAMSQRHELDRHIGYGLSATRQGAEKIVQTLLVRLIDAELADIEPLEWEQEANRDWWERLRSSVQSGENDGIEQAVDTFEVTYQIGEVAELEIAYPLRKEG